MPGRTPAEAVGEYVDSIQRAVSCVTNAVVGVGGGYYVSDTPHTLDLNERRPVRLGGATRLWLSFRQYYRVVEYDFPGEMWTVEEVSYRYRIMDDDHREILAYHWHPMGRSSFITQHLHIGHGAMLGLEEFQTAHLPTGRVSLADILRFLIRDFGAVPRRPDWESVLIS